MNTVDPKTAIDGLDQPLEPEAPKGLQKAWAVGEQLPWKGIWFEVSAVGEESIVLKPIGTTWKRHKQIEEGKRHG